MRAIGWIMMALGGLAVAGQLGEVQIPTARWFFNVSREVPLLHFPEEGALAGFPWFGWLASGLLVALGLALVLGAALAPPNPVAAARWRRFKAIRRGYISLLALLVLAGLASLDQALVGKRALAVRYDGQWMFPAFRAAPYKNSDFGVTGDAAHAEVNYRDLKQTLGRGHDCWVLMPLLPHDPTGDTLLPRVRKLVERDGLHHMEGASRPFSGLVARMHPGPGRELYLRHTVRDGQFHGPVDGWDRDNNLVYHGSWQHGALVEDRYVGTGSKEEFLALPATPLSVLEHHPAPPAPSAGSILGTTSQGFDVLAYLYGGLQVNFKAALIYLPAIFAIGVTVGLLMGFFGSWFDLLGQRLIEIFGNMPFLFVVIIISSTVPDRFKGLPVILTILIAFGWMGMTYLMRTAAYRDRERDYIAAARVLGAGTPRIIFRHLMPNTVAILVTLVPFAVSGLIFSLTALDYLGFGLPATYATWGRLLQDGIENLSAPWLVTSACAALVVTLVLITFVGEAIREAFDPKKHTYYR